MVVVVAVVCWWAWWWRWYVGGWWWGGWGGEAQVGNSLSHTHTYPCMYACSQRNKEVLIDAVVHAVNKDYPAMAGDFIKLGFLAPGGLMGGWGRLFVGGGVGSFLLLFMG